VYRARAPRVLPSGPFGTTRHTEVIVLELAIVVVSTRPNRQGVHIAKWFREVATKAGTFDVKWVDLAEVDLPMLDEPNHPRFRQYEHEHTKRWSAIVDRSDAFVFVTPEYNYSTPPSLVNAVDYVFHEWHYKPCAFVNYGGISGGLRSAQMAKLLLTSVKVMPIPEAVTVPFFAKQIENGVFTPNELQEKSAQDLLAELHRWAEALKPLRAKKA
jgi:NAD(P)H-dependent FMN reductase